MTLIEIGNWNQYNSIINHSPFVSSTIPAKHQTATYWINVFLAPDESNNNIIFVDGFQDSNFERYTSVLTLNDCIDTEKTFFWDNDDQRLYVHFNHNVQSYDGGSSYETFFGYTDNDMIYIDDQEFLPQILSVPNIKQTQDLVDYKIPSFINGSVKLSNTGGILDFYKDLNIFGNSVFVSYINEEDINIDSIGNFSATRADINRILSFVIDDYELSMQEMLLRTQDIRVSNDKLIPVETFELSEFPDLEEEYLGDFIPVAYGKIRELRCIPSNGNSFALIRFYAAITMSDFGTVEILIDDVWTEKEPVTINLTDGWFELSSSEAKDATGKVREVKLVDCEGIQNTNAGEVIKDLNERFTNVPFTSSFYDVTEFNEESSRLSEISIVYDTSIKLYNAINKIQNGCNFGFRYEINSNGLRTIRIDDEERDFSGIIWQENINNLYELGINTNKDVVYSEIKVDYDKSYNSGNSLSVFNEENRSQVINDYKKDRLLTIDSVMINESDAIERASRDSNTFNKIPNIVSLIIDTPVKADRDLYLKMRIFDIFMTGITYNEVDFDSLTIEGSRDFYGIEAVKIISINPKPNENLINVTAKILFEETERFNNIYDFNGDENTSITDFDSDDGEIIDFNGD